MQPYEVIIYQNNTCNNTIQSEYVLSCKPGDNKLTTLTYYKMGSTWLSLSGIFVEATVVHFSPKIICSFSRKVRSFSKSQKLSKKYLNNLVLLSTPVLMHSGLICITLCLCVCLGVQVCSFQRQVASLVIPLHFFGKCPPLLKKVSLCGFRTGGKIV